MQLTISARRMPTTPTGFLSPVGVYLPATEGKESLLSDEKSSGSSPAQPRRSPAHPNSAYWRANLKLGAVLLLIWFVVSFGFGILLVEPLNRIAFFGFKLGFWWAQQGSIFVFVVLIFVYSALMKRIDKRFDVHEEED